MVPVTKPAGAVEWFKSSYSGGNTTECVEVAHLTNFVGVRDSKNPEGPRLMVSHSTWGVFVHAIDERWAV